jgi:CRISPR-associated protein Cmr2
MTDWRLKLITLLHDPPNKALNLKSHEWEAFKVLEEIVGVAEFEVLFGFKASEVPSNRQWKAQVKRLEEENRPWQFLKLADQIASAIDRTAYPNQVRLFSQDYVPQASIKHPFSGAELELPDVRQSCRDAAGQFDETIARQAQLDALTRARNFLSRPELDTPQKKYLALWRTLPHLVDNEHSLLPPDTRMVDHTLWMHLDAASAVVGALPQPAFLHVGVGPVQTFIAEARRTQDLWVGSYILSYLTWAGLEVIAEEYGPDAVLYPALRGQPLVDKWLESKEVWDVMLPGLTTGDPTIASIPNKFVALMPAQALDDDLPKRVEEAIREQWRNIAAVVKGNFPSGSRSGVWEEIWQRQIEREDFPEVYWASLPWPNADRFPKVQGAQEALRVAKAWLGERERYRQMLELYRKAWEDGTHSGTMYGVLYELVSALLDARKQTRDFDQSEEDGEKCTVINGLSALRTEKKQSRAQVRAYWQRVHQVLRSNQQPGGFHQLLPDGRERLSAVTAVKRFAWQYYFRDQQDIPLAFPSTTRVAAAPFYQDVLEKLAQDASLGQVLNDHLDALKELKYPTLSEEAALDGLPGLKAAWRQLPDALAELGKQLLEYEADVLYPTRLESEYLERERIIEERQKPLAQKAQKTCRELVAKADIEPSAYYAILKMDGDEMGRWLSGQHPRMPLMCEAMHPAVPPMFADVEFADEWQIILNRPRPLSASLHAGLSSVLSNFALNWVRWVVEDRHLGKVVYAGGDDLLAFLPLVEVLPAARELRALFAGAAVVTEDDIDIQWACASGFLKVSRNGRTEWQIMPGPRITLSAGVAIVHHLHPLEAALEAARQAEHRAKEKYGRDALCVQVLRRSGETLQMGSHWLVEGLDVLALLDELRENFAAKPPQGLSTSLPYHLDAEALGLEGLSHTYYAALKRLIQRHRAKNGPPPEELGVKLATLAKDLPGGLPELVKWLLLARFIAQEGGGE